MNAPWRGWGLEGVEQGAIEQMEAACTLPIAVRGALMPDAHLGYGLPIGGVLATRNAVIPYAVGVDIACRMRMTVWDDEPADGCSFVQALSNILMDCSRFGLGCKWDDPLDHPVMQDPRWDKYDVLRENYETALAQLGTSGGGNHFAEFGLLTYPGWKKERLALMTHSGSRGTGHKVCQHFHKIAKARHAELPKALQHLAWLDLDTAEGQAYWDCMELMGEYAAANHELIHKLVHERLKGHRSPSHLPIFAEFENHHNFAWKEEHFGEEVIVHRKGATPAHKGKPAIIPGTMADSAYVVLGKGDPESLCSASHGAGRKMSRKQAKKTITPEERARYLQEKGIQLLAGGMDESPQAYKNIDEVMAAQEDLVAPVFEFKPWIVRMAEDRPKPWEK
jgi:tRNA-splicing ligase RtcB